MRLVASVLATVALAGQVTSFAHFVLVRHVTCAEHGATCPADMIVASIHNGGGGHDPGHLAARPVEVRLHDVQHEGLTRHVDDAGQDGNGWAYLPISLARYRCHQDAIDAAWVHTRLRSAEPDGTQGVEATYRKV